MPRTLAPGQLSRIHVLDVDTGEDRILHESSAVLYEAPNWTLDGAALVLNGDGHLFRLALDGGEPRRIDLGAIAPLNNVTVKVHCAASSDTCSVVATGVMRGAPTLPITAPASAMHTSAMPSRPFPRQDTARRSSARAVIDCSRL